VNSIGKSLRQEYETQNQRIVQERLSDHS